jgi:hypothetical protein
MILKNSGLGPKIATNIKEMGQEQADLDMLTRSYPRSQWGGE